MTAAVTARRSAVPAIAMLAATLLGAVLPVLVTPNFYYWDDTAAAAVGVWHRVAEGVLSGEFPLLNLDMWRGGNFAAEAATGMLNPVMLGLMLVTYPINNIAVAMTLAKVALLLIASGGVYVLARGHGASGWMSAVAGTALSLSGWAIFMDGAAWINGTAIMAFAPWAWWALRRCIQDAVRARDVIIAVVLSSLLPSTGNPYGLLILAIVFLALGVETLIQRRARRLTSLILIGLSILLLSVIVFLPFVLTSPYGNRAESGIWNDEFLAVGLNDIAGMSTPTHLPSIAMWGGFMQFPGTYLAWFVLPLLPWLKWRWLSTAWRDISSVLTFGAVSFVLVLGPSQLGMFRWPARLLPFLYLAIIVFFAVAASRGLATNLLRLRSVLSIAIVLVGVWIAVSDKPYSLSWHALATLATIIAVLVVALWARREWVRGVVMLVTSIGFLAVQLALSPANVNVANYELPESRSAIQDQFAEYQGGTVVEVFDVNSEVAGNSPEVRWSSLLPGNMPAVAGFASTTAYSGIGFTKLDEALCTTYNGGSCAQLWDRLWKVPEDGNGHLLVDLLGADTVVVSTEAKRSPETPDGWTLAEDRGDAAVFTRDSPIAGDGSVTAADDGVTVSDDSFVGAVGERVVVDTTSGGRLYFGRIAWPGYTVELDGKSLSPDSGPAGLLTVELPEGLDSAVVTVSYSPPGFVIGLAAAGAGVLIAAVAVLLVVRDRRRS